MGKFKKGQNLNPIFILRRYGYAVPLAFRLDLVRAGALSRKASEEYCNKNGIKIKYLKTTND